ncbi:MAG: PD-(D/E)XK nuclease family transposase, partial [Chlamydiota bacterium]
MLISFDYAIKFLLKNKADFYVVEDFISSLLELVGYPKVKILTVKDPENQKSLSTTKVTIPDLLVEDEVGKHYLIEIEKSFFSDAGYKAHYNTSYATVHHFIDKGGDFSKIEKVIHISILYQAYGNVNDYLYHGKTEPRGINTHQKLMIQKNIGGRKHNTLEDLPEYFYVFPENFHESFKSKFDEWVHMLKTGEIRPEAFDKYRDFKRVEKRLDYLNLNDEEKREFDKLQADRAKESCKLKDAEEKGLEKGREEGLEKGR